MKLLAAMLILWCASFAVGQEPAAGPTHFSVVPVSEGVFAAIAKDGDRTSVGNAGFIVGREGVLVVDTFAAPEAAEELLAEIRRRTKLPVRWAVNTHYHLDHVGGNAVLGRAGAVLIAHENVRSWMRTENLKWRKEITPEDRAILERLVLPDVTHREGLTIWLGDRKAEVLARPGHTGGDSIVVLREAGVVFAGDLVWRNTVPNCIDADTAAWETTLSGFLEDFPAAVFVPGHGDVARALDVRFFRDYVSGLRLGVLRAMREGRHGPELVEWLLNEHRRRFSTWKWFDQFARRNIELTEQEVLGTKRYAPKG
jgi:cyclase